MKKNISDEFNDASKEEEISKLINLLLECVEVGSSDVGFEVIIEQLQSILGTIKEHLEKLHIVTSTASSFSSLGQIEQMMIDLRMKQDDWNLKNFVDSLNHLKCEQEFIAQKKTNLSKKTSS